MDFDFFLLNKDRNMTDGSRDIINEKMDWLPEDDLRRRDLRNITNI